MRFLPNDKFIELSQKGLLRAKFEVNLSTVLKENVSFKVNISIL